MNRHYRVPGIAFGAGFPDPDYLGRGGRGIASKFKGNHISLFQTRLNGLEIVGGSDGGSNNGAEGWWWMSFLRVSDVIMPPLK